MPRISLRSTACTAAILVLAGGATADVIELSSVAPVSFGQFGLSVSGIPDINGDGYGDVIVGAPNETVGVAEAGRIYVFSGRTGNLIRVTTAPNAEFGGQFGFYVAGIGDINNDGRGDYIVGAPFENGVGVNDSGRVYVYSGINGALIRTHTMPGANTFGNFGYSVAAIPDLNNDGRPDYIVGAPGGATNGQVFIYSGASGALIRTTNAPASAAGGDFGHSVAGMPDGNGDGRGDYVVGAPYANPGSSPFNAGRAYVFSGNTGNLLFTLASPNQQSSGQFGVSVAGVADVNGNGGGDVVVGAWLESVDGLFSAGRAYVFSGTTGGLITQLTSPTPKQGGNFGFSLAGLDDRNGDGRAEVLIGAPGDGGPSNFFPGRAYVMDAFAGTNLNTLSSPYANSGNREFGYSVSAVPDANGDGRFDFIVGADEDEGANGLPNEGRAYLIRQVANDGCSIFSDVPELLNGSTPFTTIGATGGGSGAGCAGSNLEKDIWYSYTATCTGTLTIETCGSASFDTIIAVYGGCGFVQPLFSCNLSNLLGCNDDACGTRSKVTVPVQIGNCYRVRVGGFQGADGTGTLQVSCAPTCAGDLDGNGAVDAADLAILLGAWGSSQLGPDINGDGIVNAQDLAVLLGNWGPC
jgi:hypothetical protein